MYRAWLSGSGGGSGGPTEPEGARVPDTLILLDVADSALFRCARRREASEPLKGGEGGVGAYRKVGVGVTLGSDDLINIPPAKLICSVLKDAPATEPRVKVTLAGAAGGVEKAPPRPGTSQHARARITAHVLVM